MHIPKFLFALISFTLTKHVSCSPTQMGTLSTPPPPGETYLTNYPICATPGYTVVPGSYNESIHQSSGATLGGCINECRTAYPGCKSIAFNAEYTECLWYDRRVGGTQLYEDGGSGFVHYDLICVVDGCY
ncbi:1ff85c03-9f3f-41f5-800e-cbb45d14ece3 [Sclerotinia trifoliorum]|uniref:1ff85c03-9f3f-41f5-800e-cbb45d14ece3 n=1 Tax=Sclerotinia trifoliorum TaxID=28548 RepID=A0A8H2VT00_9HELO|nr:1ff85c03-9f3f-41f5-800e-cbb45d14ece3 [Sclerotinia trifoliorum]